MIPCAFCAADRSPEIATSPSWGPSPRPILPRPVSQVIAVVRNPQLPFRSCLVMRFPASLHSSPCPCPLSSIGKSYRHAFRIYSWCRVSRWLKWHLHGLLRCGCWVLRDEYFIKYILLQELKYWENSNGLKLGNLNNILCIVFNYIKIVKIKIVSQKT